MDKPKVLVIDDEEIVRLSCVRTLQPEGYDVKVVQSGIEGLKVIGKEAFDLVLTDLKMPDMDGIEVLKRVKEGWPETEIVVITGYGTVGSAVQAIKFGAFDYLEKPFTPDQLLLVVSKALEKRRLLLENIQKNHEQASSYRPENITGASKEIREGKKMEKGRILVLDDDPVVNLSCRRVLSAEGFDISTVERGEDALKKLSKESFDLMITDVRLPDISGMDVLKEVRVLHPELDVVIITGYPTLEDAKESIRLGAFEYIEKPFTPDFILNVAKKLFDKRGWILRKDFIDQFRNYIVSLKDADNPVIYYKEGTWARPTKEGIWEVGCDMRYWLLSGQLLFIDFPEGLSTIVAGEPFAKVLSSTGETHELVSPMTGVVKEINGEANTVMTSLVPEHLGEGWLLWLVRVVEVK